jgi:hypothetical protein
MEVFLILLIFCIFLVMEWTRNDRPSILNLFCYVLLIVREGGNREPECCGAPETAASELATQNSLAKSGFS